MRTVVTALILFLFLISFAALSEDAAELEAKGIAALKLSQTDADAIVSAAVQFGKAVDAYELAKDDVKATEMNSFLYWCKKKMTLQQMDAFLKGGEGINSAIARRMNELENAPKIDEAQAYFERAEAYAKAHPNEHLLIAIRFYEIAGRFKGSELSLQAQDRSLQEMTLTAQNAASPVATANWKPLFNGKDLTGWEGDPNIWRVANGMIVGRAARVEQNSSLICKTPVSNFVLRADWKTTKAVNSPNSSIQFRCKIADQRRFTVSGYQMNIGDGHSGELYDELGRGVIKPPSPEAVAAIKAGDWNHFEIEANGPRIKLSINGMPAVDWEEGDPMRFVHRGLIALQYDSPGDNLEVRFRNVEISALPPPAQPDFTIFPPGSKPLNLIPLINPAQHSISGRWELKNGTLVGNGGLLEIPFAPPEEYDYRIEFVRADGKEAVLQLFSHAKKSFAWAAGAYSNTVCEFISDPGVKPQDKGKWLYANRRHVMLVQVRKDSVKGFLDGNQIAESNYEKLGDGKWHTRNPAWVGLANVGTVMYLAIEVLPMGVK